MTRPGLGPAVLQAFDVFVDGKAHFDWDTVETTLGVPVPEGRGYSFTVPQPGLLYMPGDPQILYMFAPGPAAEVIMRE